jgi:hypothetical protein
MSTKCLLCTAVVGSGQKFYDHLEDVHMMPIRRKRITHVGIDRHGKEKGLVQEETHDECMERFKFNHKEYGTELCWCPDCVGGETLAKVNKASAGHGQLYIKGKHK